ncbi:hypothetical protein AB9H24_10765 [Micrococcus luteus]|uniref:hypothetical protein n=1 Tax=Micrococcus luteus TaxID=1270 RepID=UPI0035159659
MSADGAPRRRGPRRADAPGTGPAAADGREPRLPEMPRLTGQAGTSPATTPAGVESGPAEAERDRWLREQRPPHWG